MVGPDKPPEVRGVIPRAFEHIFNDINVTTDKKFLVRASFLEIYNEEIRDLLSKNPKEKLELKDHTDHGVYVKDLSTFVVKDVSEMRQVMMAGQKNRSVGATLMNIESSRSHSIFTITIESFEVGPDGKSHIRAGKLNMVDLAGSERQSKTGSTGDTLKEATKINLSLSALGHVISALVDSKSPHGFVPYRDSKLTRLLQDSLGGNTKTVMIAQIGPADYNYDETLSTLRYAYRAKSIKNKPRINEDPKDAMIREFQEEIARLKAELESRGGAGGVVEKQVVVEKVVEKVVREGPSEDEIKRMQENLHLEREAIQKQFEDERHAIEQQKNLAEEERRRLMEELKSREEQEEEHKRAQEALLGKLKAMEAKMLQGTQVMQQALQQEQELKKAQIEIEERRKRESQLHRQREAEQEEKLLLVEKYNSQEEHISKLTNKLEKLWKKYKAASNEIEDLQQEFQQEREDMLESIRDLTKELKLKNVILTHFVPEEEYHRIEQRAQWDAEEDEWVISRLEFAGNNMRPKRPGSALGLPRPTSEQARLLAIAGTNPRYRYDNIIANDLDLPDRTTSDWADVQGQQVMPENIQAALDAALNDADDATGLPFTDFERSVYYSYTDDGGAVRNDRPPSAAGGSGSAKRSEKRRVVSGGSGSKRPGTASRKGRGMKEADPASGMLGFDPREDERAADDVKAFPKARGLVKA